MLGGQARFAATLTKNALGLWTADDCRITGFPMRFIPMDDASRRHVAGGWKWRYLRGVQCILLATRGLVSTSPEFIARAFGETFDEFQEILAMPDRYIIYRKHYEHEAARDWRKMYRRLSTNRKDELLRHLEVLNNEPRQRPQLISRLERPFRRIIEHYCPHGHTAPRTREDDTLAHQRVSVGYDNGPG